MAEASDRPRTGPNSQATLLAVLAHPLRPFILAALGQEDLSATLLVENHLPEHLYKNKNHGVSLASFHFRALERAGCIEPAKEIVRRGTIERIFRSTGHFCMEPAEQEPTFEERQRVSASGLQAIAAESERAVRLGSFDGSPDRHMSSRSYVVDHRGREELIQFLDAASAEADRICQEAHARQAGQERSKQEGVPVTFSILGYQPAPLGDPGVPRLARS